jgi:hypothetical protein
MGEKDRNENAATPATPADKDADQRRATPADPNRQNDADNAGTGDSGVDTQQQ